MIENLTTLVDRTWDYSSRTLDALTPAASNGSYIDDIGYAVWTYSDRSVINPPTTVVPQAYLFIDAGGIDDADTIVLEGGTLGSSVSELTYHYTMEAQPVYWPLPPQPAAPAFTLPRAFATEDCTWEEGPVLDSYPQTKRPVILNFQPREGTLLAALWWEIRRRLPVTNRNQFLTKNDTTKTYVRNIDTLARHVDISSISVNSNQPPVTAISPLHGVAANHFYPANGALLRWVSMDNQWVERTVASSQWIDADCRFVTFSSPLPATILPAKLMPNDASDYFSGVYTDREQYALALDSEESAARYPYLPCWMLPAIRVNRLDIEYLTMLQVGSWFNDANDRWENKREIVGWLRHDPVMEDDGYPNPYPDDLQPYASDADATLIAGDSGHPIYAVLDNEMVILNTVTGSLGEQGSGVVLNKYTNTFTSLTGGTCKLADLSRFQKINTLPIYQA